MIDEGNKERKVTGSLGMNGEGMMDRLLMNDE
jgi:hypothetical protein